MEYFDARQLVFQGQFGKFLAYPPHADVEKGKMATIIIQCSSPEFQIYRGRIVIEFSNRDADHWIDAFPN